MGFHTHDIRLIHGYAAGNFHVIQMVENECSMVLWHSRTNGGGGEGGGWGRGVIEGPMYTYTDRWLSPFGVLTFLFNLNTIKTRKTAGTEKNSAYPQHSRPPYIHESLLNFTMVSRLRKEVQTLSE